MDIPTVSKQVVCGVSGRGLNAVDEVVAGFAGKGADGNNAVRIVVVERAGGRQELAPLGAVVLVVREQGQVGAVAGTEGEGRRDEAAVIGCVVDLGVRVTNETEKGG